MGRGLPFARVSVLSLAFILGFSTYAAIEFPPGLKSEKEIAAFADRIRALVPEVNVGAAIEPPGHKGQVENYVRMEQALLTQLKADPEYMRQAQERPALQTLSFQQVTTRKVPGVSVNSAWADFLRTNSRRITTKGKEEVLARLDELFKQWPATSLNGFFSAWAGLLSKEDRTILRNQNLEERWSRLKETLKSKDLSEIRGKFKAEKFGVQTKNWTWKDLDKAVDEMTALENEIAVLIQQLNPERSARGEGWFNVKDFAEWQEDFPELDSRVEKMLEVLKTRLSDTYSDPNGTVTEEFADRELILKELPPYQAIYRGCVGHDCSTGASWAFPYAPMERDWWVETPDGRRLGYVSGAITQVNGVPTLYLRDITGPGITAEDIQLIIDGFYAARSNFGAQLLTLMPINFTGQNHFAPLVNALLNYRPHMIQNVQQVFTDERIRVQVLGRQPASSLGYDNPASHMAVRQVNLTGNELENIRVRQVSGKSAMRDPNKHPDALWELLQTAVTSNSAAMLEMTYDRKVNWMALISSVRNERGLNVKEYYAEVENHFETNKLPFSRNMMRKNELLFMKGHLASPDAFRGENVRQSVRYVTDMIWRGKGTDEEVIEIVSRNLSVLEENELFGRSVQGLFERRQNDDVHRVELLFRAGFRFLNSKLSPDDWQWVSNTQSFPEVTRWIVDKMLNNQSWNDLTADDLTPALAETIARLLNNEDEKVDEQISIDAAALIYRIPSIIHISSHTLNEVQASILQDENLQIRVPLAIAYLRLANTGDRHIPEIAATLAKDITDTSLPRKWRQEGKELAKKFGAKEANDCESNLKRK